MTASRKQVEADKRSSHKFAAGQSVKEYAEALRGEIDQTAITAHTYRLGSVTA
jgi:hypothetical protein